MKGLLLAASFLSLTMIGCHRRRRGPTGPEPAGPHPPAGEVWLDADQMKEAGIVVEPVGLEDVDDTILTSGRVTFADVKVSHVFSPVTGRVMAINAQLGQHVKKGDPLAVIQSPDIGQFSSDSARPWPT
jgi:cobalt-zinc-cadmium efflux system membrane fusion protein